MSDPIFIVPYNFLTRPEDRAFIHVLADFGFSRDYARVALLLLWKDFAQHGAGERMVLREPAARGKSVAVRVIEETCEWKGEGGGLVSSALEAGVLKLREVSETEAALVLTGFAAVGRMAGTGAPGGASRRASDVATRARTLGPAQRDAEDALGLFSAVKVDLVQALGKDRLNAALVFLYQICRIMGWKAPEVTEWARETIEDADRLLGSIQRPRLDRRLEWLASAKNSDEIPGRLDLLVKRWETLPPFES